MCFQKLQGLFVFVKCFYSVVAVSNIDRMYMPGRFTSDATQSFWKIVVFLLPSICYHYMYILMPMNCYYQKKIKLYNDKLYNIQGTFLHLRWLFYSQNVEKQLDLRPAAP